VRAPDTSVRSALRLSSDVSAATSAAREELRRVLPGDPVILAVRLQVDQANEVAQFREMGLQPQGSRFVLRRAQLTPQPTSRSILRREPEQECRKQQHHAAY
jgi:hypothetical protein